MDKKYQFLQTTTSPVVIVKAVELYGTKEIVGKVHNPVIMGWAKELGIEKTYTADEIAWCGLFVAVCVKRAGFEPLKGADVLWARNWAKWGVKQKTAKFGDILTFSRDSGGHVGFYVAEDKDCYHVLGGNQSNMVNVIRIEKKRCIGISRCPWKVAEPKAVKTIVMDAKGVISKNEA